jgi:moderate conductance mechanosensitive channel
MIRSFGLIARDIAALIALAFAVLGTPAATAADPAVPTLPQTLTRESVRELLSQLSDRQVRDLLLAELDRKAAAPAPTKSDGMAAMKGMGGMAGMAGMVDQNAGTMRGRLDARVAAMTALPSAIRDALVKLATPGGKQALLVLAGYLAALLMTGWLAERLYDHALRNYRARLLHTPPTTFSARAFQLALALLLDIGGIAVFVLGALALFFAFWLDHDLRRIAVLETLFAIVVVRIVALFARFLLAPGTGRVRLLPFDDAPARRLRRFAIAVAALYGFGLALLSVMAHAGAAVPTIDALMFVAWIIGLVVAIGTVWRVRRPIAELIRGRRDPGSILARLADLWPVAATVYFLALFAGHLTGILAGMRPRTGVGAASILLLVLVPIIDLALCRALAAYTEPRPALASYQPVFRRTIHIVTIVGGLLVFAALWDLDFFTLAQESLGVRIASSLVGIAIVLLAAFMLWEIAKMAIDRRLTAEGEQSSDVPSSRLRTVLPLLRVTILITIVMMATMSTLAALGVDILPLLAGASVVGVAIGFGSQTLVRDIVSGAFFLMDDAFRLGEYIEVGDAKGRVEKINVRTLFLRHHRGALNILPYGEIKRLRNTSRDWSVHVLEFRLTYDTNMLQVKKIMKQIGEELAADPDYADDVLQPLKSTGVMAAEDSALVVRAKFTARPTNNAWVIRRMAYDKIIREFRKAGIRFAHRQVTVEVPTRDAGVVAAAGAAAAAVIEPQVARTG